MSDIVKRPSYPPVPQRPERQSEGMIPAAFRSARRNRHVSVPLAVPPALWAAAAALHAAHLTPETAVASLAVSGAVAYFAQHKWDRPAERWYATLTAAAAGTYLTAGAIAGVTSGLPGEILGGALLAGGIAWGIPWYRHYRPRGRRRREKMITRWDAWWQGHAPKWSLAGSRVIDAHEAKVTVRIRVQLMPGTQSVNTVKQAVDRIETALEGLVETGHIRIQACKNPSQVDLFFKWDNPLREPVAWEPAMAPRSVHETYGFGVLETGTWRSLPLRRNRFVNGESRSGKSNDLLVGLAALTGCADDIPILIDLKGGRSARPVLAAGAAGYVVTGTDEARALMLMLAAEIQQRAKHAYSDDEEEQLHATPEIPAIHLLIDETNGLTSVASGNSDLARLLGIIASQGKGLAVYTWVYTQYGSLEESVQLEQTRANLDVRIAYRVAEARHGQFTIDYGKLDASKLKEEGTCYLKDGPETVPEQIRAPHMPHRLLREIATANAERLADRPPLALYCGDLPAFGDVPEGTTMQQWWDRRWLRLDPAFRKLSPQYAEAVALYGGETAQDSAPARSAQDAEASPAVIIGADARTVAARIAAETGDDDWVPDRKAASRLGQLIRNEKEVFADVLQGATGSNPVSPSQLQEESGRGHSWVHEKLAALSDRGAVVKVSRGLYAAAPGADIAREIEAIDAGTEQLLKAAQKVNRELVGRH
jgi:hypothetical protein